MSRFQLVVSYGQFHDVVGVSRQHEDVVFVPAQVTLNGSSFDQLFYLKDYMDGASPEALAIIPPGEDAAWVLGRLIRLFRTELLAEEDRAEKTFFFATFVAVFPNRDYLAVPFECSDHYGRSWLTFSSVDSPPSDLQQAISSAFWHLLLSDPQNLADYSASMDHPGAGARWRFGVEDGEPFLVDDDNE